MQPGRQPAETRGETLAKPLIRDLLPGVIRPRGMPSGRVVFLVIGVIAVASPGCGNRAAPPPPPPDHRDATPVDAAVEIDGAELGLPDLASFGWRKRGGQAAFQLARKAEDRGDWAQVVATCRQALAFDPTHLEASWLLAVGLAKLGQLDQVLAPLQHAAAGDFAKWGQASLELPGMQPFLATAVGAAWRRRVERDRARLADAIARGVIVATDGDLFAVALDTGRWYRLTRSPGFVVGAIAIPEAHRIAYVARTRRRGVRDLGIGIVDLAEVRSSRPIPLGTPGPIAVAYSTRPPVGAWIGIGGARATAWRQLDDDFKLHPLPPRTARPPGPWLEITARGGAHLHAMPPGVTADWDDQALASAIRIGTSNRVVSVPSPGLIDGNTAAWSADRVHLAFAAQLDDHCAPGAVNTAAFVADASTGTVRELERAAAGIAVQWLAERRLAIAGDHGVSIVSLDGAAPPIVINGATGLVIPRERPRCTAPDLPEPIDDEPGESAAGDEPVDAGVIDAR
jgi:hypothetical protein